MEENKYTEVGETFIYNGKTYRVEEHKGCEGCEGCAFAYVKGCPSQSCNPGYRKDNKSVIFKEVKTMTKKDLKPGMVVEYANGELKIVFPSANGELFLAGMDWWGSLSSFTEDLKCTILTDYNIQKVYTIKYGHTLPDIIDNKRNCLTLLWERPEEKVELTLEEIAEKFNIPVESLRIKD